DINLGLALAGLLLLIGMQRMQAGHVAFPWFAAGLAVSVLAPLTLGGGENQLMLLAALGLGVALALILGLAASMAELAARLALLQGLTGAATALIASLAVIEGLLEPGLTLGIACLSILLGAFSAAGAAVTHARLANLLPRVWRHISQAGAGILLLAATLGLGVIMALRLREGSGWLLLFLGLAAASGVSFTLPLAEREAPLAASLFGSLSGLGLALLGMALDLPPLVATGILSAGLTLLLSLQQSRSVNLPLSRLMWGVSARPPTEEDAPPVCPVQATEVAAWLVKPAEVLLIPGFGCMAARACAELVALGRHLEQRGQRVMLLAHPLSGCLPGQMALVLREAGAPQAWLIETWPQDRPLPEKVLSIGAHDLLNPTLGLPGMPDLRQAREVILLLNQLYGFSGADNPLLHEPHVRLWLTDARAGLAELNALLPGAEEGVLA
ncbi:MAG: NAD(P)(+) transhydrogenase (Re/Si-specific) subunit beta, partial [Halothiobacillaceae bacterium]